MFIDANVFIHAYESSGRKHDASKKLLKRIASGEMHAHTSALVLNEVLHYFLTHGEGAEQIFANLLKFPHLVVLPVDERALSNVVRFVKAGLQASDAYHAAVMKTNSISTICSYDTGFDRVSEIKRQEP